MAISFRASHDRPPPAEGEAGAHVRTQLLRRIAHDIASPTGVTLTVLEELAASAEPRPELIAMARRSLRRLLRLSEQLAVVAELESSDLDPELVRLDVRTFVRQSVDDAMTVDGRKDVAIECELPSAVVHIAGEQRLLGLALREVVGNALRLASSRVRVSVTPLPGSVSVRVDDDGPGFGEEALATFGQRFVNRPSRGLGLSLSMAMEIVQAHGGRLDLEASSLPPGRRGTVGASVVVTLPAAV